MKTLIKILCLSSFLICDTLVISQRDGNQSSILKNIIIEDCSIEGLNRTILYKKSEKSIIENNSNQLLGAGLSLLLSGILNFGITNSIIENDEDIDRIKMLQNISNASLLAGGIFLLNIDNPYKIYTIETHRIDDQISLYDGIRNQIEIDCRVIEGNNK
tara:strand:+ start:326 stop:802 length:477 start_codon:yes stop_codon:yes gene_type:complete